MCNQAAVQSYCLRHTLSTRVRSSTSRLEGVYCHLFLQSWVYYGQQVHYTPVLVYWDTSSAIKLPSLAIFVARLNCACNRSDRFPELFQMNHRRPLKIVHVGLEIGIVQNNKSNQKHFRKRTFYLNVTDGIVMCLWSVGVRRMKVTRRTRSGEQDCLVSGVEVCGAGLSGVCHLLRQQLNRFSWVLT